MENFIKVNWYSIELRQYDRIDNCMNLLYGFSARIGSPVNTGSDWPSLFIAETSNWYRWPGLRPFAVALQPVV